MFTVSEDSLHRGGVGSWLQEHSRQRESTLLSSSFPPFLNSILRGGVPTFRVFFPLPLGRNPHGHAHRCASPIPWVTVSLVRVVRASNCQSH